MDNFNSLTKHINYEAYKKVILNKILSDMSIKAIIDFDYLNGNVMHVLVSNLRKTLLRMSKSKDDPTLKRSSIIMILNSDVEQV